jgi:hypothetical protein
MKGTLEKKLRLKFEPHPTEMHLGHPCWRWTDSVKGLGYGWLRIGNPSKALLAHRLMYEQYRGPIPEGLSLDHLCRNKWCVNPDHLEAVTHRTNVLRGVGPTAINARMTHCRNGHEFTPETIVIDKKYGYKKCRICRDRRRREYHLKYGR